jgi:hypothetical protein
MDALGISGVLQQSTPDKSLDEIEILLWSRIFLFIPRSECRFIPTIAVLAGFP